MTPTVLAIAAHPDDIEFVMAGTLLHLERKGWRIHYFTIANGCCGSQTLDREQCAAVRLLEAQRAASLLKATFHPPICNDLEIYYCQPLLEKVAAVVRKARPSIVLTHSLSDYMEDHQNAARLAVSATFVRSMPNAVTAPPTEPYEGDVAIYHAQPHGNRDPMGGRIFPTHFVDVRDVIEAKRALLSAHASQQEWLHATQGMNAYVESMVHLNREVGEMSRRAAEQSGSAPFEYAEGWRRHFPLGFGPAGFDPLPEVLGRLALVADNSGLGEDYPSRLGGGSN